MDPTVVEINAFFYYYLYSNIFKPLLVVGIQTELETNTGKSFFILILKIYWHKSRGGH